MVHSSAERCRVLGPVTVTDAHGTLHPQLGQAAVVVSLLATAWPRAAPLAHIEEALWPHTPPKSAHSGIQVVVAKIRNTMRLPGEDPIPHAAGGYRLALPADEMDLQRFVAAVAASAHAIRSGLPAEALAAAAQARALWSGEPFGGASGTSALMAEATRLREMLLELDEFEIDAYLALGDSSSAASRARALAHAEPLRERRWEQLMLALYRCGRQAEALRAFTDAATHLRDELGLDPGNRLRALESAILMQDPDLDGNATTDIARAVRRRETSTRSAPPRTPGEFIGREWELVQAQRLIAGGGHVSLVGCGGVGKTRLAVEALRRMNGSRAQTFVSLGTSSSGAVGERLAMALGIPVSGGADVVESLVPHLASTAEVIVLDDCDHVARAAAHLVERLVRRCASLAIVTTCRAALGNESEQPFVVEPLSEEAGRRLLISRASHAVRDWESVTDEVSVVLRSVDRLPLGIELAAAQLDSISVAELAKIAESSMSTLAMPNRSLDRHRTMTDAVQWTFDLLTPVAQRVLTALGVMSGGFDAAAAAAVSDVAPSEAVHALRELARTSLIVVAGGTSGTQYRVLETVRSFAAERQGVAASKFRRAHGQYYRRLVGDVGSQLFDGREARAVVTLDDALDQVRTAFECSIEHGDIEVAIDLAVGLGPIAWVHLHYDVRQWFEVLLALPDVADHPKHNELCTWAAIDAWASSNPRRARARAEQALDGLRPDELFLRLNAVHTLVAIAGYEGRGAEATNLLVEAVAIARELRDQYWLANVQVIATIGAAVIGLDDVAISCARAAMRHAERSGSESARAWASFAAGVTAVAVHPRSAIMSFEAGAAIGHSVRNHWVEAMNLAGMISPLRRSDRLAEALLVASRVLPLWNRAAFRPQLGRSLADTALVLDALGEVDLAADALCAAASNRLMLPPLLVDVADLQALSLRTSASGPQGAVSTERITELTDRIAELAGTTANGASHAERT